MADKKPGSQRPKREFVGDFDEFADEDVDADPHANADLVAQLSRLGEHVRDAISFEEPELPERVGKYRIQRAIGRGGQAEIFEAYDPDLQRTVVLKVYHRVRNPEQQLAVLEEGRTMARLSSPFIISCLAAERDEDGSPFLVLDVFGGRTLDLVRDELNSRQIISLLSKLCEGLSHVHQVGVIHGDIKPRNVLVNGDGDPCLIDFGLARAAADESRSPAGTLAFASPEQTMGMGAALTPQTDIFGIGALIYFLLTGEALYPDEREAALELARSASHPALDVKHHRGLREIAERCLQRRPADRFQTVEEVRNALRNTVASPSRRWGVAAVAAVAVVAATIFFLPSLIGGFENRPSGPSGEVIRDDIALRVSVKAEGQDVQQDSQGVYQFRDGQQFVLSVHLREPAHLMVFDYASRNNAERGVLYRTPTMASAGSYEIPDSHGIRAVADSDDDFLLVLASKQPIQPKDAARILSEAPDAPSPARLRSFVLGELRKTNRVGAVLFHAHVAPR